MLDILSHQRLVYAETQLLMGGDQPGEILPAAGSGELLSVHRGLQPVKVLGLQLQIGQHCRVNLTEIGVLLPWLVGGLHVNPPHPVQRDKVKLPHGAVILRGISGGHNNPALRQAVGAEGFAL